MSLDLGRNHPLAQNGSSACAVPGSARARLARSIRGRSNHFSGIAAEDSVARAYTGKGATVLGRRVRTPAGEIDLVLKHNDILVFVEVKRRRTAHHFDSPITTFQWSRLENAALHYMVPYVEDTGIQPVCRFDAALVAPDGQVEIIENARSFDEQ
ncbi:MAG: YraN family protein [Paracoccaceae bacterium]